MIHTVKSFGIVNKAKIDVFLELPCFFHVLLSRKIGGGNGNPLQYSCLENPMDGGAWWATVHEVSKSWAQLSDLTFSSMWDPPGPGIKRVSPALRRVDSLEKTLMLGGIGGRGEEDDRG